MTNAHPGSTQYRRIGRWALGIDGAFLVVLVFNFHGPIRVLLGLVFALLIPGWSIVGHFRLKNPALEFALTVAASLAILMVAAQVLLAVHWWHLWAFDVIAAVVCGTSLAWQGRGSAPDRSSRSR